MAYFTRRSLEPCLLTQTRAYSDAKPPAKQGGNNIAHRIDAAAVDDRDLYLSVLSSTASRREARSYLQRFTPPPSAVSDLAAAPTAAAAGHSRYETKSNLTSSNSFKKRNKATAHVRKQTKSNNEECSSPVFTTNTLSPATFTSKFAEEELHVALVKIRDVDSIPELTLQGIGRTLGQLKQLGLLTIVVLDDSYIGTGVGWRAMAEARAERVISAVEASRGKARRVDDVLNIASDLSHSVPYPELLLAPLSRGVIPIVTPLAYDDSLKIVPVDSNSIVQTLTRLMSKSPFVSTQPLLQPVSLDRLIYLDPLGGIPAKDRPASAHVFVNLEQEYCTIESSLCADEVHTHHLHALQTFRYCLSILPPTASAVMTTPSAAAHAKLEPLDHHHRSRRVCKNPLVHNLLTDKPIFSSSLPTAISPSTQTTLLKHGTPLTILPAGTKLTSPLINLPKLVGLIEDSFGKSLDLVHYLSRVDNSIAAIIVAGDYDGAAIVTWEVPPNNPSAEKVCYLDKFAVRKRAQGVGGVADVVFKAMAAATATIYPEGIVWRSRSTNPVNKWYFERAKGCWKLPHREGDGWTMFWTIQDVEIIKRRFRDYVNVCESVEPSLR